MLQGFLPYGGQRYTQSADPNAFTAFDYTGQRLDGNGLHFYQARYYDSAVSRFAQPDTLVREPGNPQSLNRYAYTLNDPLNYTDPDGHFPWPLFPLVGGGLLIGGGLGYLAFPNLRPWNPPFSVTARVTEPITSSNLTPWLVHQMVANARSPVVASIRANWSSANPINKDAALQAWTALVGTDAIWDFKVDILDAGQFVRDTRNVVLGNSELNYDAVANMHFGFVGRAAGLDANLLVAAAGLAQAQRAWETGNPDDWGVCNATYWCDHPFATWSIRFGIYLYDAWWGRLNELDDAAFARALKDYIDQFGGPPPPPPGA